MTAQAQYPQLKPAYDQDGFVVVRDFLGEGELAELKENLDRYIREVVPTLPPTAAFFQDRERPETLKQMQHMGVDPYFAAYPRQARWVALAEALVGEEVSCDAPEWFNKPPGVEHPTPPHQDNYYFCLSPPRVVTLWLALDQVDEEKGCLRYVRGSHMRGIRPHGLSAILGFSQAITDYSEADRVLECKIELEPGDAVAHHGNTIHRADPNRSARGHRRAFAMVYKGESCRRDETAFARYQQSVQSQHEKLGNT
ncbi:MAG: phytanoyl-CoA dioxygenase family protein [Candidatus Handelsmanbacteria bacterium]|nr:phytanoyl-CoA dioxygenase family protein [Candidatus Handelsmanbacteria bacterium]